MLYDFEASPSGWEPLAEMGVKIRPCAMSADFKTEGRNSLRIHTSLPGLAGACVKLPAGKRDWTRFTHLLLSVYTPEEAPEKSQVIVYLKDAELNYYQHVRKNFLRHGEWTHLRIDLTARSSTWTFKGHYKPWDGYCRQDVLELGVKFISQQKYEGPLYLDGVRLGYDPNALPKQNAIYNLRANEAVVPQYGKFELSFNLAKTYANPFDPKTVDVRAHLICPDGKQVTVPGFFYQGYLRRMEKGAETLVPMGRSQWKVRFAPRQVGTYRYYIRVQDETGAIQSELSRFESVEGKGSGFIRVSEKDKFCLEFDDGTFYYPIGHNISAVFDARAKPLQVNIPAEEGTYAYDRMLKRMKEAGENFGRVWMSPWSFGIEWTKAYDVHYRGLGRYNLLNSWRLDHVLREAEQHGVCVMVLFTAHGEIGDYESDFLGHDAKHTQGSPYWSGRNGAGVIGKAYQGPNPHPDYDGPIDHPLNMYTSKEAAGTYRNKARYIAARWGYSPAVLAWEVLNEADLPAGYRNAIYGNLGAKFVQSVAQEVRDNDPAEHLITSGCFYYRGSWAAPTMRLDELDFNTGHIFEANLEQRLLADTLYMQATFDKIFLPTEAGLTPFAQDAEETAMAIHRTLWASFMTPAAGAAASWWWVLIDRRDLYFHFAALKAFAEGVDRRGKGYASYLVYEAGAEKPAAATAAATPAVPPPFEIKDKSGERTLMLIVLKNKTEAFCWICEPAVFTSRAKREAAKSAPAAVKLTGLEAGSYVLEMWDTYKGEVTSKLEIDVPKAGAGAGELKFETPEFAADIAVKVKPK